jgi:hypothetical protein
MLDYDQRAYHPDNPDTWIDHYGPWHIAYRARVMCTDGRIRMARITGTADTWFPIPAHVKVKGKTVSGYVTGGSLFYSFVAYAYGKNGRLLPDIHHQEVNDA